MIVIGYQCIGKSTLANSENRCIDLESSHFSINGDKPDNWNKIYGSIAVDLSSQGYTVFTSAHKKVRDALKDCGQRVVLIYPSIDLKDEWMSKLMRRYKSTGLSKDLRAYQRAKDYYENDISSLMFEKKFESKVITDMHYDLHQIIKDLERNEMNELQ